jgi:hypothetical protein
MHGLSDIVDAHFGRGEEGDGAAPDRAAMGTDYGMSDVASAHFGHPEEQMEQLWLRKHPLEVAIVFLTPPFLPASLAA